MSKVKSSWMRQVWDAPFLSWWIVSLLTAALYPTVFALSMNWYALSDRKILWLLAVVGIAAPIVAYAAMRIIGGLLTLGGAGATWRSYLQPILVALLCSAFLFLLFYQTPWELMPARTARLALSVVFTALLAGLFVKGCQRYFSGMLLMLIVVSAVTWIASFESYKIALRAGDGAPSGAFTTGRAHFDERPNIYFFIYDAYGSEEAYQRVHGFDNTAQYRKLKDQGFKVAHTFSNYDATIPTALSFFLGQQHYYDLESGNKDSMLGRAILAGIAPNPTLNLLKANGYRIQFINKDNYLINDPGVIDFVYPDVPVYMALTVFGHGGVNRFVGTLDNLFVGKIEDQLYVLRSRIPPKDEGPWFTFSHVNLPKHAPTSNINWRNPGNFSETFKARTIAANEHMDKIVEAIKQNDPTAIVIFMGDHGGMRYYRVWEEDRDPNTAMDVAKVDPEIVTLDMFGIMIAVYSNGRCDDEIYVGITPVNVMRAVFSCLLHDPSLLNRRAPDISLMSIPPDIWVTARDGSPLSRWELLGDR